MILIGRGLDFRSVQGRQRANQRLRSIERKEQEKRSSVSESFDVQLSGCATNKIAAISGGNDERVPPVPIPNTAVKPLSADGTWLDTARESRSPPDSI